MTTDTKPKSAAKLAQDAYRKIQKKHAKRGGNATFAKYGRDHMSAIAKKRWAKRKKKTKV